ncbi:MAG: hypothetical protein GY793_02810 [Proteobacteria bacterium]|nr:hypothetical protein [Pseudomonadota bacterium]
MYKSKQGSNRIKLAIENEQAVHDYFKKYPDDRMVDCQKALGLSQKTVSKYLKTINRSE